MITGTRVQEIFNSLKMHFSQKNYNYIQYNGRMKSAKETIQSRMLASKLLNEERAREFFIFNIISEYERNNSINKFIGAYVGKDNFQIEKEQEKIYGSRNYFIKEFLKTFHSEQGSFKKLKDIEVVSDYFFQKKLPLILMSIIMKSLNLQEEWKTNDPLLENLYLVVFKLSFFYSSEREKIILAMKDIIKDQC